MHLKTSPQKKRYISLKKKDYKNQVLFENFRE